MPKEKFIFRKKEPEVSEEPNEPVEREELDFRKDNYPPDFEQYFPEEGIEEGHADKSKTRK